MTNSEPTNQPDREATERQPRFEAVSRWVEYLKSHPPELWGPQQNAVVNGQLESAQLLERTADEELQIRGFAERVLDEDSESTGEN